MNLRLPQSIVFLAFAVSLALPSRSGAEQADRVARAMAHDEAARVYFDDERYAQALSELDEAQSILPAVTRMFNMARCHEELGHIAEAIELYNRYIEGMEGDLGRRDEASERIEALEAELRRRDDVSSETDEGEGATGSSMESARTGSSSRRRLSRVPFFALVGVTAASAVAWIALAASTSSLYSSYEEENPDSERFARLDEQGPKVAVAADVMLGLTAASAIATLVVGLLTDFSGERTLTAPRPHAAPRAGGGMLGLTWRLGR